MAISELLDRGRRRRQERRARKQRILASGASFHGLTGLEQHDSWERLQQHVARHGKLIEGELPEEPRHC